MKRYNLIVLFAIFTVGFGSCKKGGVFCYKPNGEVIVENREHVDFSKISLEINADVYVSQSEEYSVEVEASSNLMGVIKTKVSGNTLKIDIKNGKCLKGKTNIKVYIEVPDLKNVSISGSGDVFILNELTTDKLELNISGSGSLQLDSLIANELDINISGSGEVSTLCVDTLANEVINISGSGDIYSFGSPAKNVAIKVSGSGDCEVFAIEELEVDISGSGNVIYKGNPLIDQRISGSGSVKPY